MAANPHSKSHKKSTSSKAVYGIWPAKWKPPFHSCLCVKPTSSSTKAKGMSFSRTMKKPRSAWSRDYPQHLRPKLSTSRWSETRNAMRRKKISGNRRRFWRWITHHMWLKPLPRPGIIRIFPLMRLDCPSPMVIMPPLCSISPDPICVISRNPKLRKFKFDIAVGVFFIFLTTFYLKKIIKSIFRIWLHDNGTNHWGLSNRLISRYIYQSYLPNFLD